MSKPKPASLKPQVLTGNDLPSVAKFIGSKQCKNITLMLGAGVSTSAGIPDFRSPSTGLYSNLARLKLPYPEAVFEINFFKNNPVPFYALAKELYPGKFRPTLTHAFIRLLAEKNLLGICFTQNIDTLERRAGVPGEKIVEAHGSFATQRCVQTACRKVFDGEKMKKCVANGDIPVCEDCGGYVKPDIVFFGEALPDEFIQAIPKLAEADLLIVIGTSLTVHPFASLTEMVNKTCPRVLINIEKVGHFGSRTDDVILLGKCDEVVKELCETLGWADELVELWDKTRDSVESLETLGWADELVELWDKSLEEYKKVPEVNDKENENEVDKLAKDLGKHLALDAVATQIAAKQADDHQKENADAVPITEQQSKKDEEPTSTESTVSDGPNGKSEL